MRNGWLEDADVAILARRAVDLLAEDIVVEVEGLSADPDRSGGTPDGEWIIYPLLDGGRTLGMFLPSGLTPVQALAHILIEMSENVFQSTRLWGIAFPTCPGHPHPATIDATDDAVVLTCPATDEEVGRLRTELPS